MNNIHLHIIGSESFFNLLNELNFNYIISSNKNLKYNSQDPLIRIIFVEQLQLVEVKKYLTQNIPTIFLFNNKDYLKKNKLILLEFHASLFLPIDVLSLKEILNILITKYNFFKKSHFVAPNSKLKHNSQNGNYEYVQTQINPYKSEIE
jgi:hypothetical protein